MDVFGVALACLDLLSAVATRAPVLLAVDDAHWLDRSSLEVLAFVARRLSPDPVLLLVATRAAGGDALADAGLPELVVGPLDAPTSATLIDLARPDLDPGLRDKVLTLAAGNPLAVLELPLSLHDDPGPDLAGGLLPLTSRLERSFAGRVSELPEATRDLLLAAAVGDTGDVVDVLAVAGVVAGTPRGLADLEPAAAAGLAVLDGDGIRFRHALVRSAVHQAAPAGRRQAVHAALARVTVHQPDRYAWHLAHAVSAPDESVARELDAAALRAERRGAVTPRCTRSSARPGSASRRRPADDVSCGSPSWRPRPVARTSPPSTWPGRVRCSTTRTTGSASRRRPRRPTSRSAAGRPGWTRWSTSRRRACGGTTSTSPCASSCGRPHAAGTWTSASMSSAAWSRRPTGSASATTTRVCSSSRRTPRRSTAAAG